MLPSWHLFLGSWDTKLSWVSSNLSGQPAWPVCSLFLHPFPYVLAFSSQLPSPLGRLTLLVLGTIICILVAHRSLSTSDVTPRSIHLSNCLLNIPLILPPGT